MNSIAIPEPLVRVLVMFLLLGGLASGANGAAQVDQPDPFQAQFPYGIWVADGGQINVFSEIFGETEDVRYDKILRDLHAHYINAAIPAHRALTRDHMDMAAKYGIRMATMPMYLYSHIAHHKLADPKPIDWVKEQWTAHINELKAIGEHPGFLAYHVFDEPHPAMSGAIQQVTDYIQQLDPRYPVLYTQQSLMLAEDTPDRIAEWQLIKSLSVVLSDCYSIHEPWGRDPWIYGDIVIPEYSRPNPAAHQWPIVQSFGYDQIPTVPELGVMIYNTIAHGAKGMFLFTTGQSYITWHPRGLYIAPGNPWFGREAYLDEIGRIGEHLTTAGPLLLPLKYNQGYRVKVDCETFSPRVRLAIRAGSQTLTRPTINTGAFTGTKYDILVVHNNHPWEPHSGTVTVNGRKKAFDLLTLQPVGTPTANGVAFPVEFAAGDGRLYLLGDDDAFATASAIILNRRYQHEAITLTNRMNLAKVAGVAVDNVEAAFAYAETLIVDKQYAEALPAILKASELLDSNEAGHADFAQSHQALDAMRSDFGQIDQWLLSHPEFLQPAFPDNATLTTMTNQVVNLTAKFSQLENAIDAGTLDVSAANNLRDQLAALKLEILSFRPSQLQPARITIIQIGNETDGVTDLIRWLGMLYTDVQVVAAEEADLHGRDLVWIHLDGNSSAVALKYCELGTMPADILSPEAVRNIRHFVEGGGGLICTGIAAGLVKDLGLEDTVPGEVYWGTMYAPGDVEMKRVSWGASGKVIGIKPTVANHPLFKEFSEEGFGIEIFDEAELLSRAVWNKNKGSWPLNGTVLAGYYTDGATILDDFGVAVEYRLGKGKCLFMGDGLDLNLGRTATSGLRGRFSRWESVFHKLLMSAVATYRRVE